MADIFTLADKLESALLKGTGFHVTTDEALVILHEDIAEVVFKAKLKRLKAGTPQR